MKVDRALLSMPATVQRRIAFRYRAPANRVRSPSLAWIGRLAQTPVRETRACTPQSTRIGRRRVRFVRGQQ
jgi:hypothetical protein